MALLSPHPQTGSSCDFCKVAPATLLVNGHLACERHKHLDTIELGSSSSSPPVSSPDVQETIASSSVGNNDDDILDVWDPAEAAAEAASLPPTPPLALAGIGINSSSISGVSSTSSVAGSQRKRRSADSLPLVAIPPWGSPAAPLADSLGAFSDNDDDVRITGTSISSGVIELTGASVPALGATVFGGSNHGGGGGSSSGVKHRRRRRSLPLPVPPPAGAEVIDLAAAAAFLGVPPLPPPRPQRRHRSLGGTGSDGSGQKHQLVLETTNIAVGTTRKKRRAEGKQTAVESVDETETTQATAVEARAGAGAVAGAGSHGGAALDASKEAAMVEIAPSAAKQGKKPRKRQLELECIVCFGHSPIDRCARCPEGHAMCKTCVKSYVTETLMPQGTVSQINLGASLLCFHWCFTRAFCI